MHYIALHPISSKDQESIIVPYNIGFEGASLGHTTIWWSDDCDVTYTKTVKETPDEIKSKIANKEFVNFQ